MSELSLFFTYDHNHRKLKVMNMLTFHSYITDALFSKPRKL